MNDKLMKLKESLFSTFKGKFSKLPVFLTKLIKYIIVVGLCFIILKPIIIKLFYAVMPPEEVIDPTVRLIPKSLSIFNIDLAMYALDYKNTIFKTFILAFSLTLIQLIIAALTGYGFARMKFWGSKLLFAGVVLSIIVPKSVISLPNYLHFRKFDIFGIITLINGKPLSFLNPDKPSTIPIYILTLFGMGMSSGMFIYIFRQFFISMPKELEEAALIDGCGIFQTFYKIMLPNAKGAIVTVGLFSFVWQWNDDYYINTFAPNLEVLSTKLIRVSKGINSLVNNYLGTTEIDYIFARNPLYAGMIANVVVLLSVLPLIILFLFIQKQFVESVERSGIVG